MHPVDAAKAAGLPTAAVPEMMKNPVIRREIESALADDGITPTYFSNKLKELCEASNSKGNPDWSARAKGVSILRDIFGFDAPKKIEQKTTISYEERLLMIGETDPEIVVDADYKEIEHG
jgi:hypothetical protein